MEIVKELPLDFTGIGEVRGFSFSLIAHNGVAYIYSVRCTNNGGTHFEVFERRKNDRFGVISYPKSKSFGIWAYCCDDLASAMRRYEEITDRVNNRGRD